MEGVASERDALIAQQSGADMVQGYYFARPALVVPPAAQVPDSLRHIRQLSSVGRDECR
jgi:EAL domain-containing protein (putative c-di-GMP-specific phosphodiesterase class I)